MNKEELIESLKKRFTTYLEKYPDDYKFSKKEVADFVGAMMKGAYEGLSQII